MRRIVTVVAILASVCLLGAASADARVVVGIGVGPFWGGGWGWGPYWGAPYGYPPYYPPAYYAPSYPAPASGYEVVEPQSYIQAEPAPNYWYFCEGSKSYYPYVQQCPGGWVTVTPGQGPEPRR